LGLLNAAAIQLNDSMDGRPKEDSDAMSAPESRVNDKAQSHHMTAIPVVVTEPKESVVAIDSVAWDEGLELVMIELSVYLSTCV
jgi:hypothetical protein